MSNLHTCCKAVSQIPLQADIFPFLPSVSPTPAELKLLSAETLSELSLSINVKFSSVSWSWDCVIAKWHNKAYNAFFFNLYKVNKILWAKLGEEFF